MHYVYTSECMHVPPAAYIPPATNDDTMFHQSPWRAIGFSLRTETKIKVFLNFLFQIYTYIYNFLTFLSVKEIVYLCIFNEGISMRERKEEIEYLISRSSMHRYHDSALSFVSFCFSFSTWHTKRHRSLKIVINTSSLFSDIVRTSDCNILKEVSRRNNFFFYPQKIAVKRLIHCSHVDLRLVSESRRNAFSL